MSADRIRVASYNLWLHKAYPELGPAIVQNNLDVLCLQESNPTRLKIEVEGLRLAGFSSILRKPAHGLSMYYNPTRLRLTNISNYRLPLPAFERASGLYGKRLQLARFAHLGSGREVFIANMHLSNLLTPNYVRRRQTKCAIQIINEQRCGMSAVIVGDFNYPFRGHELETVFFEAGFAQCGASSTKRTHVNAMIKGKFDRIFISADLQERAYDVLPFGVSDHAPVLADCVIAT